MNETFFRTLRESRVPFLGMGDRRSLLTAKKGSAAKEVSRILIVGGHARQIQDISSIARSLSGGADVESTASIAGAQERLIRGKDVHWVVAAIRPFDPSYEKSLRDLHCRMKGRSEAKWMALWPGLRPPSSKLDHWEVYLSYPASVGQLRRALSGEVE